MALSVNSVWEVRSATGSDTNGGGFVTGSGGTDYSQQGSANSGGSNSSVTDAVGSGSTSITSATAAFTSAITGNIVYFDGAWYQATYSNATTITTDRATTSGTGLTLKIGGALATLTNAVSLAINNNVIYCKGSQTITSTLTLSQGTSSGTLPPYRITGYSTARGDGGRFTLTTATNSTDLINYTGNSVVIQNVLMSCTAGTPGIGIAASTGGAVTNLTLDNVRITGFSYGIRGPYAGQYYIIPITLNNCEIDTNVNHGIYTAAGIFIMNSYIHDNGSSGLFTNNAGQTYQFITAINSVFYNNVVDGIFQAGNFSAVVMNCVLANNFNGLESAGGTTISLSVMNTIVDSNSDVGLKNSGNALTGVFKNNGFRNNGTDQALNVLMEGSITLTADPFTNRSTGDFSLNNTAGGGLACDTSGFQSTIIG